MAFPHFPRARRRALVPELAEGQTPEKRKSIMNMTAGLEIQFHDTSILRKDDLICQMLH